MSQKDFYAVLGVKESVTADELKRVYRTLAKQYHPDTNTGDAKAAERFKEISEAYNTLGDAAKRREYDEMRRLGAFGGMPGGGFPGGGFPGGGARRGGRGGRGGPGGPRMEEFDISGIGGFGDLFGSMFGGAGPRRPVGPEQGQSVETTLRIPFRTAVLGGKVPLDFELDGVRKSVRIAVAQGSEPGSRIKLSGQGGAGQRGGPAGDLYITLEVAPDPVFTRDGRDLIVQLPLNIVQATLGTKLSVRTIDEKTVTLTVPKGTVSGKRLRVRGQGVTQGGKTGDLLVELRIAAPESLTPEQEALLVQFAEAAGLER
jgi:molecular chaperone DnaJ